MFHLQNGHTLLLPPFLPWCSMGRPNYCLLHIGHTYDYDLKSVNQSTCSGKRIQNDLNSHSLKQSDC
jgi:hypothetical protein